MSGGYEVNKWYGWNGGECPVHAETEVEYAMRDGSEVQKAKSLRWSNQDTASDIIAFRIIKPHVDLIEGYMLSCEPLHATREMAEAWLAELKRKNPGMFDATKIVHMKEVRE